MIREAALCPAWSAKIHRTALLSGRKTPLFRLLVLPRCHTGISAKYLNKITLLTKSHQVAHIPYREAVEEKRLALFYPDLVQTVSKRAGAFGLKFPAQVGGRAATCLATFVSLSGLAKWSSCRRPPLPPGHFPSAFSFGFPQFTLQKWTAIPVRKTALTAPNTG